MQKNAKNLKFFLDVRNLVYICSRNITFKVFISMEKKLITEAEMKEQLETKTNLGNCCVDLETARKIIMDAVLPLCK